jgi:hypothetical protein
MNNREKIVMIVDLDSKESYTAFLNQIKDLGMTKVKYYYVLATLVGKILAKQNSFGDG